MGSLGILVVDDNPDDRRLIARELQQEFTRVSLIEPTSETELARALEVGQFDLVITDFQIRWTDGIRVLKSVKNLYPDVPVVMFTGSGNEEIAAEAMKLGLDDYVTKAPNRYFRLRKAARAALEKREQQRALADVSRLRDDFLATISHELRTPLNAIVGWSQMLRADRVDEDLRKRAAEVIARNARAQAQIVDDMLDMSRLITGRLRLEYQPVDLATVVEQVVEVIRPAASAKEIEVHASTGREGISVMGDPDRLRQIAWNLVSNAVKFTPEGGRIEIESTRAGSRVELAVRDTGIGISPEHRDSIFERFRQVDASTTRHYGGLGLGLAIVRHLAELHGGTVRVESEGTGHGSRFVVSLPVQAVKATRGRGARLGEESLSAVSEDVPASLLGLRILAIDDDPDARELLAYALSSRGAAVRTAASSEEGFSRLGDWRPDVILSDIGMPEEDGYEFIAKLRALDSAEGGDIPAIAVSALAQAEAIERSLSLGFQAHCAKPCDLDRLVDLITRFVLGGR